MRQCTLCHKGSRMGGTRKLLRGHYNPVNWSRKYPNLQYTAVDGVRTLVCTACIKTMARKTVKRTAKTVVAVATK